MKAPKSCQTCVHLATHEKCNACTFDDKPDSLINWEFGDWLSRVLEYEKAGKRQIVLGGQGEAEVNAKQTPKEASKHLHYVAEECGYMSGNLRYKDKTTALDYWTSEGHFRIYWDTLDADKPGKLHHINRVGTHKQDGHEVEVLSWPAPLPDNWGVLWTAEAHTMREYTIEELEAIMFDGKVDVTCPQCGYTCTIEPDCDDPCPDCEVGRLVSPLLKWELYRGEQMEPYTPKKLLVVRSDGALTLSPERQNYMGWQPGDIVTITMDRDGGTVTYTKVGEEHEQNR